MEYNVFVIEDPFSAFEASHPDLISISSIGHVKHAHDVEEEERASLRTMLRATQVAPGLYVGGAGDAPEYENPHGWSLVVRVGTGLEWPDAMRLYGVSRFLEEVEGGVVSELVDGKEDGRPPQEAPTSDQITSACTQFCRDQAEYSTLDCGLPWAQQTIIDRWINFLAWLQRKAEPTTTTTTQAAARLHRGSSTPSTTTPTTDASNATRSNWAKKILVYSDDG